MPKGFSDHEKELIRARLLEGGYRLFSAYGLRKTNVEELAQAAGISKGAFYLFYDSKEALFMDVVEEAEARMRREVMAVIDQPGESPRARLYSVLRKAFDIFESIPLLRFVTGSDFDQLFRRIPAETLQAHLASDAAFIDELIAHCRRAGIPITAPPEHITGLLDPLALTIIYKEDQTANFFTASTDLMLKLIAAYCLGEVEV